MEITLGEFPPMEITPGVSDYSCLSLIRRRVREGGGEGPVTTLPTHELTYWRGRGEPTRAWGSVGSHLKERGGAS